MKYSRVVDTKYVFCTDKMLGCFRRHADGSTNIIFSSRGSAIDPISHSATFDMSEAEVLGLIEALHAVLKGQH